MSEANETFCAWALVELFGHQRIVGKVTEQTIGGGAFIRVDVPDADGKTRFTRFYGHSAIYAISPIDQVTAISLAQAVNVVPVQPYELPRISAGGSDEEPGEQEDV